MPDTNEEVKVQCWSLPYFPRRYVIIIMLFLGMLVAHAQRVSVGVTAVTILNKKPIEGLRTWEDIISRFFAREIPSANWTSEMVGYLHSVFYVGYILTQLPGGYLCTILPSQRLFGGCIIVSCSLNLLLPVCFERLGYTATCVVRVMQGLSEGLLFPSCYAVMSNWTIPEEKSRVGALVLTGVYIGPFLGLATSGALTQYYGWNYVYYFQGVCGILWFIMWLFLVYELPNCHPYISEEELRYIKEQQGANGIFTKGDEVPWTAIFSSPPVLSLCVANFARSFVFFMLLTNEPVYINIFGFSMAENGVYSALPHAIMACVALSSGPIADYIIASKTISTTNVRKSFTCIGFGMESMCMFILNFVEDGLAAVAFLTIGVGFSGLTISGWQINHLDLAPRYASILVALTTLVGTLAGIFMPVIVGTMTTHQTLGEWQSVFLLTSLVLMFSTIIYGIFGSGSLQTWAEAKPTEQNAKNGSPPYGTFEPGVNHVKTGRAHITVPDDKSGS